MVQQLLRALCLYADGTVDTSLLNFYSYPGYGQVPSVLDFQIDLSDPTYFGFRIEELPQIFDYIGEIRLPYSGSSPPQYLVCSQPPLSGACNWFTIDQIEAALGIGGTTTVPASLGNLPPSAAVESTVLGLDTNLEDLNQSIADSDGLPNDGESGDYDAYGPDGTDLGQVYFAKPTMGLVPANSSAAAASLTPPNK